MIIHLDEHTEVDTDSSRLPVDEIYQFLKTTYWAQNRSQEIVAKSIQHSLNFGLYHHQQLIGFARVITDYSIFAYLCDVYILPEFQGKGWGIQLMKTVQEFPELQNLRRWMLATKDAHGLYEKVGYQTIINPDRWMEIFDTRL